jgi:hypothetical protein
VKLVASFPLFSPSFLLQPLPTVHPGPHHRHTAPYGAASQGWMRDVALGAGSTPSSQRPFFYPLGCRLVCKCAIHTASWSTVSLFSCGITRLAIVLACMELPLRASLPTAVGPTKKKNRSTFFCPFLPQRTSCRLWIFHDHASTCPFSRLKRIAWGAGIHTLGPSHPGPGTVTAVKSLLP